MEMLLTKKDIGDKLRLVRYLLHLMIAR
jgi:hypothetical protein